MSKLAVFHRSSASFKPASMAEVVADAGKLQLKCCQPCSATQAISQAAATDAKHNSTCVFPSLSDRHNNKKPFWSTQYFQFWSLSLKQDHKKESQHE